MLEVTVVDGATKYVSVCIPVYSFNKDNYIGSSVWGSYSTSNVGVALYWTLSNYEVSLIIHPHDA